MAGRARFETGEGIGPPGDRWAGRLVLFSLLVTVSACTRVGTGSTADVRPTPRAAAEPIQALEYVQGPSAVILDEIEFSPDMFDQILDGPWRRFPAVTEEFERWMAYARGPGRQSVVRNFARQGRYGPLVDSEIDARGLPRSLKWLPVIESSYLPSAESRVGAVGLWQLMGPTATDLGLEVGTHLDQRLDPMVSTGAGLDYLADLEAMFDSWLLALAAYNGGPGRVGRLLDRYAPGEPPSDELYDVIAPYLPRETREFVPKFIAYAMIARTPEPFGITLETPDAPLSFEVVEVPDATSLDVIARAAGTSTKVIEDLNPQVLRGYTPFGTATQIRVPDGTSARFRVEYPLVPEGDRVSFIEHQISRGETLSHLASRYGVPVSEIRGANPGVRPERLRIGQWITVPRVAGAAPAVDGASARDPGSRSADRNLPTVHLVRAGDSLWTIARRYEVSVDALARENGLAGSSMIHPGRTLRIPSGAGDSGPTHPRDEW